MEKKEVHLEFNLPEFAKEDIKVKVNKNNLVIDAEKKQSHKIKLREDFISQEASHKNFYFTKSLPDIDTKNVKVTFAKNILKITLTLEASSLQG